MCLNPIVAGHVPASKTARNQLGMVLALLRGPRSVGDVRAAWRQFRHLETGLIGANGNEVACLGARQCA